MHLYGFAAAAGTGSEFGMLLPPTLLLLMHVLVHEGTGYFCSPPYSPLIRASRSSADFTTYLSKALKKFSALFL